ncbi:hypothetical protein Tco_0159044 [Tanacetum coccineum]
MSLEWDRFVTTVKLNKGLKEINHEQLYAYLKQHGKHAAQDRLIIDRITPMTNDQLAFISSVQPYTQSSQVQSYQYLPSSAPLQSPYVQSLEYPQFAETSQLDSGYTQTDEILYTLKKQDGQVVVQNVQGLHNQNQRNFAQGNGAAGNRGAQNRAGNANAGQGKPIKCYNCNGLGHITQNYTQLKRPQNYNYFKDKMLLMQAQENGAVLDEKELLFLAADESDAFDSDVDDEPTGQSIFMANLSSVRAANLQDGPSNASILSEVHDLDNAIDPSDNNLAEHEIHNETVNDVSVVPSSASSIPNDAYVLHDNDAYIPTDPLATELNIYKEQAAIYEQRAKKAKKAQPTLYDGDELLKTHHVPVTVTSSKEDLELAETIRIKMNEKMNNSVCVEKRVKIIPPNYSKENFMVTFTPQTQLTTEQVFWSNEIKEKKAEDLKAKTPTLLVLPPTIVYPSNTHVHLFPQTLPNTTQVNIGLAMKVVFENLEDEVDQNVIALKSDEIEWKNLLITNETLIANCIAQDMFYTITDSYQHLKENLENFKSKSSKVVPEFDAFFELGKQDDQIQGHKNTIPLQERLDNFKAENEKVKQHYQELFNSIKITRVKTIENTTSLQTEIEYLKTQLKGKMPCVTSNVATPKVSVFEKDTLDTLSEIVEEARSNRPSDNSLEYACVYTKHSQELLEYVNASYPNADNKRDKFIAATPLTRKMHVTFAEPFETSGNNTSKHVKQQSVQ